MLITCLFHSTKTGVLWLSFRSKFSYYLAKHKKEFKIIFNTHCMHSR